MSDLKPCPFCGNTDVHIDADDGDFYAVLCDEGRCAGNSGYFGSPESAKACWNTRVSPWRSLKDDPPIATENNRVILLRDTNGALGFEGAKQALSRGDMTEWMEVPG